jgi:hypothetical protein
MSAPLPISNSPNQNRPSTASSATVDGMEIDGEDSRAAVPTCDTRSSGTTILPTNLLHESHDEVIIERPVTPLTFAKTAPEVFQVINMFFEDSTPRFVFRYGHRLWWELEELKSAERQHVADFCNRGGWKGLLATRDNIEYFPRSQLFGEASVLRVTGLTMWQEKCMVRVRVVITVGPEALKSEQTKEYVYQYFKNANWQNVF